MARRLLSLALLLSACGATRPPPAPPRKTNVRLTISTSTLANGQRVVIVNDPNAIDVQVTMRFQVGSINDGDHPGIAHLVEHMMFEQTLEGQPLFTHFEDTASFFNAFTSFDATTYVARAPTAQLDKLIALEAARLSVPCSTISEATFAREREVVLNELTERDQNTEVYSAIHGVLYPKNHPYRQAIGGSEQSVRAITLEQVCAFADTYYSPRNGVLVISGNVGDRAHDALAKLGTTATKRVAPTPRAVPHPGHLAAHLEVPAPVDDDVLVLAWALPAERGLQTKVRAIAAALPRLVDAEIEGTVVPVEFGDRGAPMYGLAVLPAEGETLEQATAGMRKGIEKLPTLFATTDRASNVMFDRIREGGIYSLYSSLEDGGDRDSRLAAYVLAGLDPTATLAAEIKALRNLSRDEGAAIVRQYLDANAPTVITLKASAGKKRGEKLALRKPIHDIGQRRTPPDPALARKPADAPASGDVVAAKTHVLPNGLKVVLLPMSSVPTVDIRLIFGTGTADEARNERGIATLTANALTWDLHHLNDILLFVGAGGMKDVDVGADRTSFSVQGMGTQVDVLLAGLRRLIREGTFDDDSAKLVLAMRRAIKRTDDEGALTDSWRAAMYGPDHPYVQAGIARHSSKSLTLDDAARFRAVHYMPSNATLVIAGSFDPALADRWIEFLFGDWRGHAVSRPVTRSSPAPASIAKIDDIAMVQLRIALPVTTDNRAEQLVAAEMLKGIANDVRFELAAGYSVEAQLAERRLARHYVIGGGIDAARAAEALHLIRDRIAQLRTDANVAARAFVTARKHVIAQLLSRVGSAGSLASRVEHDVEMGRAPMFDLETAASVQALTIDGMTAALADLDLARGTVLMRGPAAELKDAFGVLGRKASYVMADPFAQAPDADDPRGPSATAPLGMIAAPVAMADVEPALVNQPPPPLAVTAGLDFMAGLVFENGEFYPSLGYLVSGEIGYRFHPRAAVGLRAAVGSLDGNYASGEPDRDFSVMPIDVGGYLSYVGKKGTWYEGSIGLRRDRVSDEMGTRTHSGIGYGLELGRDLFGVGPGRIGIVFGFHAMSYRTSESGSSLFTLGFVYQR